MKIPQKLKYFSLGIIATAALIPLTLKAIETVPLTFKEGDTISASVINAVLGRLNDVQKGFASSSELVGTYACESYSPQPACTAGWSASPGGVVSKRTQDIVFSCSGGVCKWTAADFFPWNCQGGNDPSMLEQKYEVSGNFLSMSHNGLSDLKKLSPTKFSWMMPGGGGVFAVCEKKFAAPAPANELAAKVSGPDVALSWTDQSIDETGFKIQRKNSATGSWADLSVTPANATSYSDKSLTAGTYWYRVLATNDSGDAMSSSEVSVSIQ